MTVEASQRRSRRASAQAVFDDLAAEYADRPAVGRGPMFGSLGLTASGHFFAFVGREGQLVVKLPAAHAANLVAAGEATAVRAGRNATREWVGVLLPADGAADRWRELIAAAYQYALSAPAVPSK